MRLRRQLVLFLLFVGCGPTNFASNQNPAQTPPAQIQPTPTITPIGPYTPTPIPTYQPTQPSTPRPPQLTPPPSGTLQKGSFRVWTDPAKPKPGVFYDIVVEVRLPSGISSITQSDLNGCVLGTDDYVYMLQRGDYAGAQKPRNCSEVATLPAKDFEQSYFSRPKFSSGSGYAQLRIPIPGGAKLIKDTIQVRSTRLNESQTFDIIFQ